MVARNTPRLENARISAALAEMARELAAGGENPYRVAAYRTAARMVRRLAQPLAEIFAAEGVEGLERLPGVGDSLARSIAALLRTGHLPKLDALRKRRTKHWTLASLPGVGEELAARIREVLGTDSLGEVFAASYDGRLRAIPGIGNKRLQAIRECLSLRLQTPPARKVRRRGPHEPRVAVLLDVDGEYRQRAAEGTLPAVAPHRFNPTGAAWLPVLHTQREGREFRAMFSNTARAHELERSHDWVVVFSGKTGCWTVVTGAHGPLKGKRVVRGREAECLAYYRERAHPRSLPGLELGRASD
jgi:Holliday junction resolvasome RuvABC DNA-binding subunit